MEVANTLAYYDKTTVSAVKSFILQSPLVQCYKTFDERTKLVFVSGRL